MRAISAADADISCFGHRQNEGRKEERERERRAGSCNDPPSSFLNYSCTATNGSIKALKDCARNLPFAKKNNSATGSWEVPESQGSHSPRDPGVGVGRLQRCQRH